MKALNLHGIGDLRYEEVPIPEIKADEVLLRVFAAGICGSDIPRIFTKGTYNFPTIPGHEFAGEIIDVGAGVDKSYIGKQAAVFPLLPCFACEACAEENYAGCADYDYYGSRRDGAFAEYIAVKIWNVVLVPDSVFMAHAAMAEPCAVAIHAFNKAGVEAGETVCIFGAGAIGLLIAQLVRGAGADAILIDIDDKKLKFAKDSGFGCGLSELKEKGADVCFDAAGVPETIAGCLRAANNGGRVVLMGNPSGDIPLKQDDYWQILRKQLSLFGTWNSDYSKHKNDWATAISYMENGTFDLSPLITHEFALADVDAAFGVMREGKEFFVKVLFLPQDLNGVD